MTCPPSSQHCRDRDGLRNACVASHPNTLSYTCCTPVPTHGFTSHARFLRPWGERERERSITPIHPSRLLQVLLVRWGPRSGRPLLPKVQDAFQAFQGSAGSLERCRGPPLSRRPPWRPRRRRPGDVQAPQSSPCDVRPRLASGLGLARWCLRAGYKKNSALQKATHLCMCRPQQPGSMGRRRGGARRAHGAARPCRAQAAGRPQR